MDQLLKGLFGGSQPSPSPVLAADVDNDFADFVQTPSPTPVISSSANSIPSSEQTASPGSSSLSDRPYTKWYNVHERASLSDFKLEMLLLPLVILSVVMHYWGAKRNRQIARQWMNTVKPVFDAEYAEVGFKDSKVDSSELSDDALYREKSKHTFLTYATGRQNVAFMDVTLQLYKRENIIAWFGETAAGFLFESWPMPAEKLELTVQAFDGQEAQYVLKNDNPISKGNSTYDGFVWAVVHKDHMKQLRDDRYDLSITSTKEHAKLPDWATVMSESAEITDLLLTQDLIKAIESCGDSLEALIVTDMPEDAPKTLQDLAPKKRVILTVNLDQTPEKAIPLIQAFLRIPDNLAASAHLRPEVMRRVKATREETIARIRKTEDNSKAEERKTEADKQKKDERDRKLKAMNPNEQRKFLAKEREKDNKRSQGKRTIKA